jgi:lipoprotein-releasing system permease protein
VLRIYKNSLNTYYFATFGAKSINLNLSYFIARKVATSGQQSFSRLIIRIAILAVALSITVMIVATALIHGFKNQISSKIFGFWGHIHIMDTGVTHSLEAIPIDRNQTFYPTLDTIRKVKYLDNPSFLGYRFEDQLVEKETHGGVKHIQVFANIPGIIKTKTEIEGIVLKGIGKDFLWENMDDYLIEGNRLVISDTVSRDIIISEQTANRLLLKVGDKMVIYFIIGEDNQIPKALNVVAIYKTGLEEYDQKFAIVDIRLIQDVYEWTPDQVGGFEVFLDDIRDIEPINEYIYMDEVPNDLFSQTIRDKFPSIFEWLGLQDINEVVILFLMLVVSIINMITALLILILERTNMIGILKALGNTNWDIQKIFLYYAGYIVCVGLFFGNITGLLICFLQKYFEFITLSESDYYLSVAPIEVDWWSILFLNIGTLIVTLLFLVIPSYLVTRISPVKAIRFK